MVVGAIVASGCVKQVPVVAPKDRLVIADFDEVIPVNLFGWDNSAVRVANPQPSGLNLSAYVASWDKSTGQWKGMGFFTVEQIDFAKYSRYTFKIWSPVAGKVVVKFFHGEDESTKFELAVEPITRIREWQTISVDLSILKSDYYSKAEVVPVPDSPEACGPFYFDDFILYPGKSAR
jgi:hypothetical protein